MARRPSCAAIRNNRRSHSYDARNADPETPTKHPRPPRFTLLTSFNIGKSINMSPEELKRILIAFADDPRDVDVKQGKAVAQIQDELIDVELKNDIDTGEMIVIDNERRYPPLRWIMQRVARMPQLSDRILAQVP